MNAIRQSNILRRNPHPDLLPEYREKEQCAHAIALRGKGLDYVWRSCLISDKV